MTLKLVQQSSLQMHNDYVTRVIIIQLPHKVLYQSFNKVKIISTSLQNFAPYKKIGYYI